MRRVVITLVVLLLLAGGGVGSYLWWISPPDSVVEGPARVKDELVQQKRTVPVKGKELSRQYILGSFAVLPGQGFPASYPLGPLQHVGHNDLYPLEILLHYQPILLLEAGLAKYEAEVSGYAATFLKQEKVGGKLLPREKLHIHFREEPFSVHMRWLEGAIAAQAVLYVKGENGDKMIAKPRGISFLTVSRDKDGSDAKATSRYTIDHFGIYLGQKRTVATMRKAQERGELHVRYEGLVKVPELNNRLCYKFIRSPYRPPRMKASLS